LILNVIVAMAKGSRLVDYEVYSRYTTDT